MEAGRLDERRIVAVDHFAEDEGVRMVVEHRRSCEGAEKVGRDGIGHIETPAIGPSVEPPVGHGDGPFENSGVGVVDLDQFVVALPGQH